MIQQIVGFREKNLAFRSWLLAAVFAFLVGWSDLDIRSLGVRSVGAQELVTEPGFDAIWETDIEAALKDARTDKKYLLVDFTGSDWCPHCIRLDQEVLSKDAFLKQAQKNFLLVKLDFPQDQSLIPAKMMQTNQQWMKQLGVEGFPTIVLMDDQGRPFGFLGYTPGGPDPFLTEIQSYLTAKTEFDQLVDKAGALEGDAKAQGLDAALESIGLEMGQAHYGELVDEILKIDEDNHLGLREKYRGDLDSQARKAILADVLLMTRLQKPEKVLQFMDALEVGVPMTPQLQATLLQIRFDLQKQLGQTDLALETMDRLIQLYEQDDESWQRMVVQKFYYMVHAVGKDQAVEFLDAALSLNRSSSRLLLAKGDYLAQFGDAGDAIITFEKGLVGAISNPDLYSELVEAKADALAASERVSNAIEVLDTFASNDQFPADLRAKLLIHKAVLLRQQRNERAALLSENKALGLIELPKRRAELQRLLEEIRSSMKE